MGFLDSLFRNNARSLSTVEKNLEARSASVLANALDRLKISESGWITFAQFSRLFATNDATEEPSERDLQALLTLGNLPPNTGARQNQQPARNASISRRMSNLDTVITAFRQRLAASDRPRGVDALARILECVTASSWP
jgi:hypothetical protein